MSKETQNYEGLAEVFKAIGHPIRIAILNLLCNCDRLTVKNIYEKLKIEQPIASRHLGIMRSNGVLERIQETGNTYYCFSEKNPYVDCIKHCFDKSFFKQIHTGI